MVHCCLTFAHSIPTTIHHGLSSSRWLLLHWWLLGSRRLVMMMVMVEVIWHFGLWRGGWQFLGNGPWPRRMAVTRVRLGRSVLVGTALRPGTVAVRRQVTSLWAIVHVLWRDPLLLLLLQLGGRQLGGRMLVRGVGVATRMLIHSILRRHSRRRHPVSTVECGWDLPIWNVWCRGLVGRWNATPVCGVHGRRTPRVLLVHMWRGMVHASGRVLRKCLVLLLSRRVMHG